MNPRQRQARFERLRQIDQQKLERLAEVTRKAAAQVERARHHLRQAQEQFQRELLAAGERPELADQLGAWERRSQHELASLQAQLNEATKSWEAARQAVEQQQNRIRAWDKLLERVGAEVVAAELAVEMRLADESYMQKQIRQRI
ncbi:MAG: hypothetical protein ACK493_14565 [Planctomycetota bacterium]|jgi:Sec-independent protein translocase protein TatA|nr:hypothetical protein [Blastopirellula sp.]